jgi:regulator of cell morphogenesis and NO signaling
MAVLILYPSGSPPDTIMPIQPNTQIQELGKALLTARRLFRRFGIDINANPGMTLSEACAQAGITFADLLYSLRVMNPKANPTLKELSQTPPAKLAKHVVDRHHAYARRELARLSLLMEDVVRPEEPAYNETRELQEPFQRLFQELIKHMDLEEHQIFPSLLAEGHALGLKTLEDLHTMAVAEHSAVEALFQDIAIRTRNFRIPEGASLSLRSLYRGLRELEEDLLLHLYVENHLLFPMIVGNAT